MNNTIKVDFQAKAKFENIKEVYTANEVVGNFILDSIKELSAELTMKNTDLEKNLKQLTELKVFAEYIVKLRKKLKEKGSNLVDNS